MEKNLYRIIYSTLPAIILLLSLGQNIGIGQVSWYHCALVFVVIASLSAFCFLKAKGKLLMLVAALVCVVVSLFVMGRERTVMFLDSYIAGLLGTGQGQEWGIWHESMQVLWISVGIFLVHLIAERIFVLKAAVACILLGALFIDLFAGRGMTHVAVTCVLIYVAIVFVEGTEQFWKKQKSHEQRQYIVWIMPFLCLYFVLMLLMPAPAEPYDWKFVKDAFSRIKEQIVTISANIQGGEREDFEMAAGGFSGDGVLLGGVMKTGQEIMRIQGQKSLKTNVYLDGKVYDTFTGQQWIQSNESTIEDRLLDALETAYAIRVYDKEGQDNYIHSTKLHINYRYFNTGYLFAPLKAWSVENALQYENVGGNLVFGEKVSYGTAYDVRFFQINVDHALFYEFLDAEHGQDEVVWKSLLKEYAKNSKRKYTLEDLEKRKTDIVSVYGKAPQLSAEVQALLQEMTEGARTDVEKLKAIEAALADLTYTMTPGSLPKEIASEGAFLDYFLMESKKGFCSYFASTFVLLARAEGIPARYVEGFCVPVEGEQETVVYSDMAHAWPEAYIEGVGWIPFEPTPGYERIRYTPWEMVEYEKHRPMDSIASWEDEEELFVDDMAGEETLESEEVQELRRSNVFRIVLFSVIFVTWAGFVIWYVDGYLYKRRYRRWTSEEKLMAELKKNVQLLAMLGYPRADCETLEELGKRAWAIVNYEHAGQETMLQFLRIYEDVYYGNHTVSEEMLQRVCEEQKYLMEMLKKWRKFRYIYCKVMVKV